MNAGAETKKNGTPASAAIAFARCVLPVPGVPLEEEAAARVTAEFLFEGLVGEEDLQGAWTSSRTTSMP